VRQRVRDRRDCFAAVARRLLVALSERRWQVPVPFGRGGRPGARDFRQRRRGLRSRGRARGSPRRGSIRSRTGPIVHSMSSTGTVRPSRPRSTVSIRASRRPLGGGRPPVRPPHRLGRPARTASTPSATSVPSCSPLRNRRLRSRCPGGGRGTGSRRRSRPTRGSRAPARRSSSARNGPTQSLDTARHSGPGRDRMDRDRSRRCRFALRRFDHVDDRERRLIRQAAPLIERPAGSGHGRRATWPEPRRPSRRLRRATHRCTNVSR